MLLLHSVVSVQSNTGIMDKKCSHGLGALNERPMQVLSLWVMFGATKRSPRTLGHLSVRVLMI